MTDRRAAPPPLTPGERFALHGTLALVVRERARLQHRIEDIERRLRLLDAGVVVEERR